MDNKNEILIYEDKDGMTKVFDMLMKSLPNKKESE